MINTGDMIHVDWLGHALAEGMLGRGAGARHGGDWLDPIGIHRSMPGPVTNKIVFRRDVSRADMWGEMR